MRSLLRSLPLVSVLAAGLAGSAEAAERRTDLVRYGDVQIEVVSEGEGPAVVLLPSLARDSDDYDQVAEGLAATGFRVLRPKPRGIGRSIGPMANITLHDFARDIAEVIERLGKGHAVIVGHAYGNWVARMTAADHPNLVRGVVIAAAAAKQYAPELTTAVTNAGNLSLSNEERLAALRFAFFAPGNDPTVWLHGWHPEIRNSQRAAVAAVRQDEWWSGGTAPLLDLQAELDPFKPEAKRNEMKDEFGERVTVMVIPNASHSLIPEQPKAVVEALTTWIKGIPCGRRVAAELDRKPVRRKQMSRFIASIVALLLTSLSDAKAWPDQPVKMVVPFAAGGTTDVMARIVAERVAALLGRPVIIENVPGAGGNSGATLVSKSRADGYTILMATPGQAAMNQFMYKRMPYDTSAFVPLAYIASVPSVLVISPTLDVSSTTDFLAKMKARTGGANFGSAGMGSTGHLGGTLLSMQTGLNAQHVPYRGSAPMLQDLLAGNIQFTIDTVPGVMSFITSGTIKALAVTGKSRSPALPEVPSNTEAGIPDVEMASWLMLLAPAGTPQPIVDRINAETNSALKEPELRDKILKLGAVPEGGSPQRVTTFLRGETEKWKRVIETAGIKVE